MRPVVDASTQAVVSPGRGYRFYQGPNIVYPFGYGLSYSSFTYDWHDKCLVKEITAPAQDINVKLSILVTNNGVSNETTRIYKGTAAETVLVFVTPPKHDVHSRHPSKVLRKFDKVNARPKESIALDFTLTAADFSLANEHGVFTVIPGVWQVTIGSLTKNIVVK